MIRRPLFLLALCAALVCCGLIGRTVNVARDVYTENDAPLDDTDLALALAPQPTAPLITLNDDESSVEGVAAELNKIKPAAEDVDPALYLPSGEIFNPLCLLNNIGTLEIPIHPTTGCGRDNIHPVTAEPQISEDKKRIFIQYKLDEDPAAKAFREEKEAAEKKSSSTAEDPTKPKPDTSTLINEISYVNIGTVQGKFALNSTNVLATGEVETVLGLYDFSIDSESKDTLERRKAFVEGDRCNGGLAEWKIDSNAALHFSIKQSPSSILTSLYENDEQLLLTMKPMLEQFLSCPVCCIGTSDFVEDVSSGFTINPTYIAHVEKIRKETPPADTEKPEKTTPQMCFDNILSAIYNSGRTVMTNDELAAFLDGVTTSCFPNKKSEDDEDAE